MFICGDKHTLVLIAIIMHSENDNKAVDFLNTHRSIAVNLVMFLILI